MRNQKNVPYRRSRQREAILKILKEADGHPTADRIYELAKTEFPNLSLGTVYRNLHILVEQGLVQELQFGNAQSRYEGKTESHYHLCCRSCGKIEDVDLPLGQLNQQAQMQTEFQIERHRLEFIGLCRRCQSSAASRIARLPRAQPRRAAHS